MKRVYRAASLIQAAHARNLLLMAGIQSELHNQYIAGALGDLPMLETWPAVFVADEDEVAAVRALARSETAGSGPAWGCACGEQLEPQFTTCWCCGRTRESA